MEYHTLRQNFTLKLTPASMGPSTSKTGGLRWPSYPAGDGIGWGKAAEWVESH
jgi:hypothetical protein